MAGARHQRPELSGRASTPPSCRPRGDAGDRPRGDFDLAASIYRRCRRVGVTPRGLVDCQIAAVAWRSGASLLAEAADLARIAEVVGIELDPASRRA